MGENHIFRRLRRFPTQKLACLQRVKAMSIVPTKDPRSIPRYFCCFDDIANGLSYVDRVQHALMCVGMKLPTFLDLDDDAGVFLLPCVEAIVSDLLGVLLSPLFPFGSEPPGS